MTANARSQQRVPVKADVAQRFAAVVFGGGVLFFVAGLAYLAYQAYSTRTMTMYGAGMAAGLLLCLYALFARGAWRANLALFIFATAFAIYGVEAVLAMIAYTSTIPSDPNDVRFDRRTKLEVIKDMRAAGVSAWPTIHPADFLETDGLPSRRGRVYPLGGLSRSTSVYCNESGEYTILRTDEHGHNNPTGMYRRGIDAMVVGDSYAQGACVKSHEEDVSSRLRHYGVSVLNVASGSNGPLTELATLTEYVQPLQPKVVLWVYYEGNDLENIEAEQNSTFLMRYLKAGFRQRLIDRQDEIDEALKHYIDAKWQEKEAELAQAESVQRNPPYFDHPVIKTLRLMQLRVRLSNLAARYFAQSAAASVKHAPESSLTLLHLVLGEAQLRVQTWHGKLYFVYVPERLRYDERKDGRWRDRDTVIGIARKVGLPVIDFHESLDRYPDPLVFFPFRSRSHYTALGYDLLARQIHQRLTADGALPSPRPATTVSSPQMTTQ